MIYLSAAIRMVLNSWLALKAAKGVGGWVGGRGDEREYTCEKGMPSSLNH